MKLSLVQCIAVLITASRRLRLEYAAVLCLSHYLAALAKFGSGQEDRQVVGSLR